MVSLQLLGHGALAEGLTASRLGVLFNTADPRSVRVATYYAERRGVPMDNVVGVSVPGRDVIDRQTLMLLRATVLEKMPTNVQSLLLVWSRPYAVECMSITTAIAVGFDGSFCDGFCARTAPSPLYDSDGWLPADTTGWLPAMLLPSDDEALARSVIERGVGSDYSRPAGTVYLVRTKDAARNVRARGYRAAMSELGARIQIRDVNLPVLSARSGVLAYFTGAAQVEELPKLQFRPGAVADHLTSYGGMLDGSTQMSALEWLRHGATGSYGSVSEPCNHVGKFPDPAVFLDHYLRGETLLVAYWKSVAMPGQGLFIGEPLARPFAEKF